MKYPKRKRERILKTLISFMPNDVFISSGKTYYTYSDKIVFCADISGFTAMSEKLTKSREGAEEISAIINSFFNPLIKLINNTKGDILYFGGDAIIALFDINCPEHALYTAIESVKFVKKHGKVKTLQGIFNISIHIGLSMGNVIYYQNQHSYMICGKTCFRVIKLLDYAKKGEIVVDAGIKKSLNNIKTINICKGVYKINKTNNIKFDKESSNIIIKNINYDKKIQQLFKYLPKWLERRVEIKQTFNQKDGEHRKATIVFIHFKNIPFDKDINKTISILSDISNTIDKISEKYGGWVNKIDFYKDSLRALIIFGFPTKLENDDRHAVMFAKELLKDKKMLNIDLRIGINSGFIFGTPIGSDIRREYTVMGDAVNTAARIAAKSKSREITIGERVYRKTEHLFEYRKITKKFKGKSKKVNNYIYIKDKNINEKLKKWNYTNKKLIGHKKEITQFKSILKDVNNKKSKIIALSGQAGLGKSRIIEEMIKIAERNNFIIHKGNCISYGNVMSYYPWIEILNSIFNINADDSIAVKRKKMLSKTDKSMKKWLSLIGDVWSVDFPKSEMIKKLDKKIKKQKFFDIIYDIIIKESKRKSICIVIEDIHWIDSISLELLNYITRNIDKGRVLFLFTYRPIKDRKEFMTKDNFKEYKIKELSDNETMELIENMINIKNIPQSIKSLVKQKSQGNPFYVEEIIKSLIEQGFIKYKNNKWMFSKTIDKIELPDSVEGVILSRIDRLDLFEREIIQIASVLGREFNIQLLKGIYENNKQLTYSLDILNNLDMLKRDNKRKNVLVFKHVLTSEAAYNTLSFTKRRELHKKTAEFIEKKYKKSIEEYLNLLSHHYYLSKSYNKALLYSLKAGNKAKNIYANEEAINFYTRAIESYEKLMENKNEK